MSDASANPTPLRVRVQAFLMLAVAFGLGVVTGLVIDWSGPGGGRRHGPPGPPPGEPGLPPHMTERLDLTADQQQTISRILESNRSRTTAVLDEYLPRLRALTDSMRTEVRAVLTAEQQTVFDELAKEPPRRPGHHDGDRPPGPPPDGRGGPDHHRDGDRRPPPDGN